MRRVYQIARILSLDVVIGAIASGSLAKYWLDQEMPLIWWLALPLSVWVIYTADHLLDAYRLKERASTPRHKFHYRFFKPILVVWAIALISCMTWIPFMAPPELWILGYVMGGIVLVHLGLVYWVGERISWLFTKEFGVGIIYAAGVWGGPLIFGWGEWPEGTVAVFVQFFLMALINLLFFSLYEREIDEKDGHTSFVRAIGPRRARGLIGAIAFAVLVIGFGVMGVVENLSLVLLKLQGVYLLMLSLLVMVSYAEGWFGAGERYRIWGDAVFIFPALIWLI